MMRNGMAEGGDAADELGKFCGGPADQEECGPRAFPRERSKQFLRAPRPRPVIEGENDLMVH